jgi:rhamnosyltransferase
MHISKLGKDRIDTTNIVLIIPTYNAGILWEKCIESIKRQVNIQFSVLIIDSSSSDNTIELAKNAGFELVEIAKNDFNHGGTRNKAIAYAYQKYDARIIVLMTQDSVLVSDHSIEKIISPLLIDDSIVAVCGRQLPHKDADPIAQHSRYFNYSDLSRVNSNKDIEASGLKTAYMSNSFAAYRYSAYINCGGFAENLIFGEDMYLAAKMLLTGYKTCYFAEAMVYHSHNYTMIEEFKRYFDIGVFHATQPFLLENFGKPGGEGLKFAISELKYTFKNGNILWGFNSILRTFIKFLGYKLGLIHLRLPVSMVKSLSMHKDFWRK